MITHLLNYGISHNLKPQYILSADEYHEKLDQPLIPMASNIHPSIIRQMDLIEIAKKYTLGTE